MAVTVPSPSPAAAAALADCDQALLDASPLGWTIATVGRLPAVLRNPRAEPAGGSPAEALLAWAVALENSVAGHVDVVDQRDVFEQICDNWLDAGRAEMVLQHRFGGTVQIDAPWREHDPQLILAVVRSAVC